MISGIVSPLREAIIHFRLFGRTGQTSDVDAVVDTGFTDYLTLPDHVIKHLRLPLGGSIRATLADGSHVTLDSYPVELEWDGKLRTVIALAAGGTPLAGMSMLYGHELSIRVIDGGSVNINLIAE